MVAENERKKKELTEMLQYNQIQQQLQDVSMLLTGHQNEKGQESMLLSSDDHPEVSKEEGASGAVSKLGRLLRSVEDEGSMINPL